MHREDLRFIVNVNHTIYTTGCETWLQAKAIEAERSTHARYARIIERFIKSIGAKVNRDLSTLQVGDITRFRDLNFETGEIAFTAR